MSSTERSGHLSDLLRAELLNIPLEQWGFFFPVHVATWRFLETLSPAPVGTIDAGYDDQPYFKGRGSKWFVDTITEDSRYLGIAEEIMRSVAGRLPKTSFERGFVRDSELPVLDEEAVNRLHSAIIDAVKAGS